MISSLVDKIFSESSPLGRHQHQDAASEKSFFLPSLLILRRLEGMLRYFLFPPQLSVCRFSFNLVDDVICFIGDFYFYEVKTSWCFPLQLLSCVPCLGRPSLCQGDTFQDPGPEEGLEPHLGQTGYQDTTGELPQDTLEADGRSQGPAITP